MLIKMKKAIILGVLILFLMACTPEEEVKLTAEEPTDAQPQAPSSPSTSSTEPAVSSSTSLGKVAKDQVDIIPEIDISECLAQIKTTNPSMTEQQANDNCYILEAVNKNDPSICEQVSSSFKELCLAQFE
jgi:hypothetical protein